MDIWRPFISAVPHRGVWMWRNSPAVTLFLMLSFTRSFYQLGGEVSRESHLSCLLVTVGRGLSAVPVQLNSLLTLSPEESQGWGAGESHFTARVANHERWKFAPSSCCVASCFLFIVCCVVDFCGYVLQPGCEQLPSPLIEGGYNVEFGCRIRLEVAVNIFPHGTISQCN